jgi:hypothetical protein
MGEKRRRVAVDRKTPREWFSVRGCKRFFGIMGLQYGGQGIASR